MENLVDKFAELLAQRTSPLPALLAGDVEEGQGNMVTEVCGVGGGPVEGR